jgi:hypothetical protein
MPNVEPARDRPGLQFMDELSRFCSLKNRQILCVEDRERS